MRICNILMMVATAVPTLIRHPRHHSRLRPFQSYHLPCFCTGTISVPATSFLPPVCTSVPPSPSKNESDWHLISFSSFLVLTSAILSTAALAIVADTQFHKPYSTLKDRLTSPVITPINSLLYNRSISNLSLHGLHPRYQHLLASLPLLLGPALILVPSVKHKPNSLSLISVATSTLLLSAIPHQEPRFLLPIVPLILSSIQLPRSIRRTQYWLGSWIAFNVVLGVLMGIYHQGGVVPAQTWLAQQQHSQSENSIWQEKMNEVLWWRTYSPPIYLLGNSGINTTDLMGIPYAEMQGRVQGVLGHDCNTGTKVGLVAPWSSMELERWRNEGKASGLRFDELFRWQKHLNLDDVDFGEEGVWGTLARVLGKRGLVVWGLQRLCAEGPGPALGGDW